MKWIRQLRLSWGVLGLIVLLVSLLGANRIMEQRHQFPRAGESPQREPQPNPDKNPPSKQRSIGGLNATGIVTPESDTIMLYPSVKGTVVEVLVTKPDTPVEKDQVLLRMDDRLAKNALTQAQQGVEFAENQLQDATRLYEKGMKIWQLKRDGQLKAIAGAETQLEIVEKHDIPKLESLVKEKVGGEGPLGPKVALEKAKSSIKGLKLAIEAENIKLAVIDAEKPVSMVTQAELAVKAAKSKRVDAELGLDYCTMKAPAKGTIQRVEVSVGSMFGEQKIAPAFTFYSGGIIVRAEINQEWAHRVKVDQTVTISDYHMRSGKTWQGRVTWVASSFRPPRSNSEGPLPVPQTGDLVLECKIAFESDEPPPLLNQKVSVQFGQ